MEPLITFIATAHNEPAHNRMFIDSMMNQSSQGYRATIYHNGSCDASWTGPSSIDFICSPTNTGSWGTYNRQQAIEECTTDYIIQTSVQDYWLPQAVEYILKGLETQPDILIWNSINHLVGPCQVLDSQLAWSKIDWGNFALRTDIAKRGRIAHGQYCADWLYLQDLLQQGRINPNKIMKLPLILTIHN